MARNDPQVTQEPRVTARDAGASSGSARWLHCRVVKQIHATDIFGGDHLISVSGAFFMQILWGALRAVSVETMGVLVILWMLHGATDLAIDMPWHGNGVSVDTNTSASRAPSLAADTARHVAPKTLLAWSAPGTSESAINPNRATVYKTPVEPAQSAVAAVAPDQDNPPRRASLRQWFNTLFPVTASDSAEEPQVEQRAAFTSRRLDHYSRLYGIASRD